MHYMVLYKYRAISENTFKIITDKKVWLSNAKGLNDPFECSIQEMAKEWIEKKVTESKQAQIMGFLHQAILKSNRGLNFYDLSPKATKGFLKNFKLKNDFNHKYRTVVEFIQRKTGNTISNPSDTYANLDEQLNQVGIFSLTEESTNQLMWSHYGDNSKGIAIGFQVEDKLANPKMCLKVNYSNSVTKFEGNGLILETSIYANGKNTAKISIEDPTLRAAISTKSKVWAYEKEWRYIEENFGLYDLPSSIIEIVFGLNCSKEHKKEIISLANDNFDHKINFSHIEKVPNTSQFVKVDITS